MITQPQRCFRHSLPDRKEQFSNSKAQPEAYPKPAQSNSHSQNIFGSNFIKFLTETEILVVSVLERSILRGLGGHNCSENVHDRISKEIYVADI
jgi:hypothetical protein